MNISLEKIVIDRGTQSRAKIDQDVVAEYADAMMDGVIFPPVIIFHDGAEYFLADGFHRYFAAKKCQAPGIKCDVREGTLRDAILYSFGANKDHGLRRTAADKRKTVTTMLSDFEWQDWSDREIAKQCGVSRTLVAAIRAELNIVKKDTKFNRGGKVITRTKPNKQQKEPEFDQAAVNLEQMSAAINQLKKENEELQDQLTVVQAASIDDIQKEKAKSIIKDLRAQIRALEIELKEITVSRDMYQRENGELKKQVASLLKKLKKLEG